MIDDPKFVSASDATDIGDREPVVQFGLGDDMRAARSKLIELGVAHLIANAEDYPPVPPLPR